MFKQRYPLTMAALKAGGARMTEDEIAGLAEFFDIPLTDSDQWLADWIRDDPASMLRSVKSLLLNRGKSDFDILRSHPRFQSKEVPVDEQEVRKSREEARDRFQELYERPGFQSKQKQYPQQGVNKSLADGLSEKQRGLLVRLLQETIDVIKTKSRKDEPRLERDDSFETFRALWESVLNDK